MSNNILSLQEVSRLNAYMLGREDNNMDTNVKYNKPDYETCNNYGENLSYKEASIILCRLLKYVETEFKGEVTMKDIITAWKFYDNLSKVNNNIINFDNTVKLTKYENSLYIKINYNPEIIEVMKKKYKGKWDGTKWIIESKQEEEFVKDLKSRNFQVVYENANLKLNLDDEVAVSLDSKNASTKTKKVKVKAKLIENHIELTFSYSPVLVNAIKTLPLQHRKWDGENKTWHLSRKGAKAFYECVDKSKYDVEDIILILNGLPPAEEKEGKKSTEKKGSKYNNIVKPAPKKIVNYTLIDITNLARKPYKHQIEAAEFILNKKGCILGDTMGLGKTLSSILAAESVSGKKLVICPSVLKYNWQKEILQINPNAKINIIQGRKNFPEEITEGSYTIINYDILPYHIENLLWADYEIILFDEAHYIKSVSNTGKAGSNRAEAAIELSKVIPYKVAISGTPIPNKTKDLFNILKIIDHPLSKNFFKFTTKYCDAKNTPYGRNIDGSSNQESLHREIQNYMIRRLKSDMPEKVRYFIPVKINEKEYKNKVKEYLLNLREQKNLKDGEGLSKVAELAYINAMKMIIEIEKVKSTIEYADNLIEQGLPVVIFCNYKESIDRLKEYYKDNAVVVDGRTNAKEKQGSVERFQNGEVPVFLGNVKAAGVGITLTRATNLIFCGYPWTSSDLEQAEDRIHRIGQKDICNIHYIYGNNIDIDMMLTETIDKKMRNISSIIDDKKVDFVDEIRKLFNRAI